MDILQSAGAAALGSRFRRLSERLVIQAADVYKAYNVELEPSWFPVMMTLIKHQPLSVVSIAEITGQSHPFISKTVSQMKAAGLLASRQSDTDKRVQLLCLSEKAEAMVPSLNQQISDIGGSLTRAINKIAPDFLEQLLEVETMLSGTTLLNIIASDKQQTFNVINYDEQYRDDFYLLNKRWIEQYFIMEASDFAALEDPQGYIIDKGGFVLLMQDNEQNICGTVAMIPMADGSLELAKMAVADGYKGKGLGYQLGKAAIDQARSMGCKRVFLESNRRLKPAIALYEKLGFYEIKDAPVSPYARCDIQMEHLLA